ncbi:MAG TPA: FRG domain-containing protein [Candidatus Angelobacter sp.]|jgi:hypothetical protein|nr:FRG domain-containing protein [Candidatus Angelobacter sp.]
MEPEDSQPKIQSVAQLLEYVEKNCGDRFLYRGQPFGKALLPRIARQSGNVQSIPRMLCDIELDLVKQFDRRCRPHLEIPPTNKWQLLAIAQHHGMATRMLDWTEFPLIGLWFAIQESRFHWYQGDGSVWLFRWEDSDLVKSMDLEAGPLKCDRTTVFQPSHIAKRITAQGGWFTVHHCDHANQFIPLESNGTYKARLTQLVIPRANFADLTNQLNRCGVNDASLYPDLQGLCKYLDWLYLPR